MGEINNIRSETFLLLESLESERKLDRHCLISARLHRLNLPVHEPHPETFLHLIQYIDNLYVMQGMFYQRSSAET